MKIYVILDRKDEVVAVHRTDADFTTVSDEINKLGVKGHYYQDGTERDGYILFRCGFNLVAYNEKTKKRNELGDYFKAAK